MGKWQKNLFFFAVAINQEEERIPVSLPESKQKYTEDFFQITSQPEKLLFQYSDSHQHFTGNLTSTVSYLPWGQHAALLLFPSSTETLNLVTNKSSLNLTRWWYPQGTLSNCECTNHLPFANSPVDFKNLCFFCQYRNPNPRLQKKKDSQHKELKKPKQLKPVLNHFSSR